MIARRPRPRRSSLVPIAIAGLTGHLPLAALVVAAFVLDVRDELLRARPTARLLPALVDRRNVQQANGLVRATADALSIGGWAVAAAAARRSCRSARSSPLNAASFFVSALLLAGVRARGRSSRGTRARRACGRASRRCARARGSPRLVIVLGVAVTISSGHLDRAASRELVRNDARPRRRQLLARAETRTRSARSRRARCSPAARFGARRARACPRGRSTCRRTGCSRSPGSCGVALRGRARPGSGRARRSVLVNAAAQEELPDRVLGRVSGLISLTHRGAHATGLLLVAPLFAVVAPPTVFAAAALALPLVGARRDRAQARAAAARAPATSRSRRSAAPRPRRLRPRPRASARRAPTRRPRRRVPRASCSTRATISCSAAASQSSTFMLTWTRPARGSSSPSARTPGKPPPRLADERRDLPRRLERAAQVDVERDQRPARADDHAAGGRRRAASARSPASSSPESILRWSSSGPPRRKNAGPRPAASSP